ncbi:MAG TPA: YjbQ family protein [Caldithrix abyssi]|uniref:YjbQ family protein n=1 Tax=Caldithrix abyssi TaxID=187145 RepID=A0A7V5PQN5_CALAY|nr:YjbQ family protein [Caldithrix abyssi]
MAVVNGSIAVHTKGFTDIIDLTQQVRQFVSDHKLKDGQLLVFAAGSTAAISTIEYEPGLLKDLPEFLEKIIPMNRRYHHDDTWHDGNGYAHLRSTLIGPSFTVPVMNGRLVLGTWQQIILIDFDNTARHREIALQFVGEAG